MVELSEAMQIILVQSCVVGWMCFGGFVVSVTIARYVHIRPPKRRG